MSTKLGDLFGRHRPEVVVPSVPDERGDGRHLLVVELVGERRHTVVRSAVEDRVYYALSALEVAVPVERRSHQTMPFSAVARLADGREHAMALGHKRFHFGTASPGFSLAFAVGLRGVTLSLLGLF